MVLFKDKKFRFKNRDYEPFDSFLFYPQSFLQKRMDQWKSNWLIMKFFKPIVKKEIYKKIEGVAPQFHFKKCHNFMKY